MPVPAEIVVFDVCNTLYDSNTTFDFIQFVIQRKLPRRTLSFKLLSFKYSPVFIGLVVLGKLYKKDIIRQKALKLLSGLKKEELLQLSEDFYDTHLENKKMHDVIAMLQQARSEADVWLFSNSIEPVIKTIAQRLQVNYEATELEYDANDIFTGNISRDLNGRKKEAFIKRFGTQASIKLMCSDNRSDQEILKLAKKPFVVVYNHEQKKYWQTLNPTFIEKY